MKRCILFLTALSLVLCLAGCTGQEENTCNFYYLRTTDTIRYGQADAFIAPVPRHIAGEDTQLRYLLQLYLEGPSEEGFRSPIPKGTTLVSTQWEEDTLILIFSSEFSSLNNMELTLAGACLTATCHDLTGATCIQVRTIEQIYDFDLEDFTFLDDITGK